MDIAQLAQLGIGAVSLFLLTQVWAELQRVNQFNRDMLTELLVEWRRAEQQRLEIMKAQGIEPDETSFYPRSSLRLPAHPPPLP